MIWSKGFATAPSIEPTGWKRSGVSYSYDLTDRAVSQFSALDPWIAEEILDEMEILVRVAPAEFRRSSGGFVHDFVRERDRDTVYVFLTIVSDSPLQLLHLANIGVYIRRATA